MIVAEHAIQMHQNDDGEDIHTYIGAMPQWNQRDKEHSAAQNLTQRTTMKKHNRSEVNEMNDNGSC